VPVEDPPVHLALVAEELPVVGGAQQRTGIAGERRHVGQPIDGERRARAVPLQHVVGVEEVPLAVVVAERVRVDREALVRREHDLLVAERPLGRVGHRHPQGMPGISRSGRVVHEPAAVVLGHLGRPEIRGGESGGWVERAAERRPAHQIGRTPDFEYPPSDHAAGAVGDVVVRRETEHERVGEIAVVNRVRVSHPFRPLRDTPSMM
jgi:hypothetical protein